MRALRFILLGVLILGVVVVLGGVALYQTVTRAPLPTIDGTLTVAGLNAPVEVIRDPFGVPHIYASNSYDLFFAQGFTHAQDRWWQMEFFRATGDGRLQELTGANSELMGNDIFIRTIGWRRAAERDVAEAYDDETLALLQAFADGVNAYITSRPAESLALEYRILGLTGVNIPTRPWTVADSVVWQKVMAWDLSNGGLDRTRANVYAELGEELADVLFTPFPFDQKPTILTADMLDFDISLAPPADQPDDATDEDAARVPADLRLAGNVALGVRFAFGEGEGLGSNSWVVSGERSATGAPLLANDPHLGIQMPSIWYEVGLHCAPVSDECPYNVRGYALTPFPGVVIGFNQDIAWGFTNVGPDNMDFFAITVNPDNDLQYLYNGEWVDMTVHEEVIRMGNRPDPVTIRVRETRFGPIVNDNLRDDDGNILGFNNENPLAMRWTALDPSQTLKALFLMNRATDWESFRAGVVYFDAPSQNLIYADRAGNIGYQTPGLIPIRPASNDGLKPVDGSTSDHEWLGYIPFELLPRAFNPSIGYIQTANQAVVPPEYDDFLRAQLASEYGDDIIASLGRDWAQGYRGQRIVEMIEATDRHTVASFQAMQVDNLNIGAGEILPYLLAIDFQDETLNSARDWLGEWDTRMDADSPQAALFAVYWVHLLRNTYPDRTDGLILVGNNALWATTLLHLEPEHPWWDDTTTDEVETRDVIIERSFRAAYPDAVSLLGADRAAWRWGTLHTADFISNPLGRSGIDLIEGIFNRVGNPTGGGGEIVNATNWNAGGGDYTVRALPSFRMVIDLQNPENNVNINTTGQSSHPFSPYYDNLVERWSRAEYKPMLFTRAQVEANAAHTLTLTP